MEFFMFDRLFRSSKFNQYLRAYRLGQIPENHPCWNIIAFGSTRIVKTLDFALFPEADGQNPVFEVQSFLCDRLHSECFAGNIRQGGTVISGISPLPEISSGKSV